jgi:hypothetical protein
MMTQWEQAPRFETRLERLYALYARVDGPAFVWYYKDEKFVRWVN